jgi:hypothetical protein
MLLLSCELSFWSTGTACACIMSANIGPAAASTITATAKLLFFV